MSGKKNEDGSFGVLILIGLVIFCLIAAAFKPTPITYQSSGHISREFRKEGFSESESDKAERVINDYLERTKARQR